MSGFRSRYWAQLCSTDFASLDPERAVAVLPVGAVEQHGPHLPLAVDTCLLDAILSHAVTLMPDDLQALLLPTQAVGKSNEHARYPGTLSLSAATLTQVWMELGGCVAAAGVRKLVLFNSHGGQVSLMDVVGRDLRIRHDMLVVSSSWFAHGVPDGLPDGVGGAHELAHGIHGGAVETSMMLAAAPHLVAMDKARRFDSLTERLQRDGYLKVGLTHTGKLAWQAQDLNPDGACGDAAAADAASGGRLIGHAARALVALLQEVARLPPSLLDNEPAW